MANPLNDLAIAVKEELKAHPFSLPIRPARGYRPRYKPAELNAEIQVPVVPASLAIEGADRGHVKKQVSVYIGVLKHLRPESTDGPDESADENLTELDQLMDLVNEIAEYFAPNGNGTVRLEGNGRHFTATSARVDQAYDVRQLEEQRQFTSVVVVEFDLWEGGK